MPVPSYIARRQSVTAYIVKETTAGTYAYPTGADAYKLAQETGYTQNPNKSELSELQAELVSRSKVFNYHEFGSGDLMVYSRTSGAAGTAPVEDVMLEAFFGKKTVNASTDVTYTPANNISTLSVSEVLEEDGVKYATGVALSDMSVTVGKDSPLQYSFSTTANKVLNGGSALVSGAIVDTATAILTQEADASVLFPIAGVQVGVYDSNMTLLGTPQNLSSVSGATLSLDAAIGAALSDGDLIRQVFPTASYGAGSISSNGETSFYLAAQDAPLGTLFSAGSQISVRSLDLTFSRDLQTPTAQNLSGNPYPTAEYLIGDAGMTIEGSFALNWRPTEQRRYGDLLKNSKASIGVQVGTASGNIIQFVFRSVDLTVDADADGDGARVMNLSFQNDNAGSSLTSDDDRVAVIYK